MQSDSTATSCPGLERLLEAVKGYAERRVMFLVGRRGGPSSGRDERPRMGRHRARGEDAHGAAVGLERDHRFAEERTRPQDPTHEATDRSASSSPHLKSETTHVAARDVRDATVSLGASLTRARGRNEVPDKKTLGASVVEPAIDDRLSRHLGDANRFRSPDSMLGGRASGVRELSCATRTNVSRSSPRRHAS
jgi:hypothetical protein